MMSGRKIYDLGHVSMEFFTEGRRRLARAIGGQMLLFHILPTKSQ
jgi:hypothetical protein